MTIPDNTTKTPPELILAGAMGGTTEFITGQERAGQQQLLKSTVLPTDMGDEAEYLELGFTFGGVVDGDPLFREATLPEGWGRQGSDHAMWSDVVDERGIRRVGVFYKAAFYDRKAHMGLVNVGRGVTNDFVYGDTKTPTLHPDLTSEELADARNEAESYVARAEDTPRIYADRLPRALKVLEALDARAQAGAAK